MNARAWLIETRLEDANAAELRKSEKTIKQMKVGEHGYTTSWAFSLGYKVWQAPCKTHDTLIERTKDGWDVIGTDPGPTILRKDRERLLKVP